MELASNRGVTILQNNIHRPLRNKFPVMIQRNVFVLSSQKVLPPCIFFYSFLHSYYFIVFDYNMYDTISFTPIDQWQNCGHCDTHTHTAFYFFVHACVCNDIYIDGAGQQNSSFKKSKILTTSARIGDYDPHILTKASHTIRITSLLLPI